MLFFFKVLTVIGVITFMAACVVTGLMRWGGTHTRFNAVVIGAAIGIVVLTSLDFGLNSSYRLSGLARDMLNGCAAGALCGWIYWTIAMGRTSGPQQPTQETPAGPML
jgi:hypothetical protein